MPGMRQSGFESLQYHQLALWPWEVHLISQNLSILICKIGRRISTWPSLQACENLMKEGVKCEQMLTLYYVKLQRGNMAWWWVCQDGEGDLPTFTEYLLWAKCCRFLKVEKWIQFGLSPQSLLFVYGLTHRCVLFCRLWYIL